MVRIVGGGNNNGVDPQEFQELKDQVKALQMMLGAQDELPSSPSEKPWWKIF